MIPREKVLEWAMEARLDDSDLGYDCTVDELRTFARIVWNSALDTGIGKCQATIAPVEQTRHGTTEVEDAVLNCVDILRSLKEPTNGK